MKLFWAIYRGSMVSNFKFWSSVLLSGGIRWIFVKGGKLQMEKWNAIEWSKLTPRWTEPWFQAYPTLSLRSIKAVVTNANNSCFHLKEKPIEKVYGYMYASTYLKWVDCKVKQLMFPRYRRSKQPCKSRVSLQTGCSLMLWTDIPLAERVYVVRSRNKYSGLVSSKNKKNSICAL